MSALQTLKTLLPARLRRRLVNAPVVGGWLRRLRDGQVVTIPAGAGAGLKFGGSSNPAYLYGTNEPPVQQCIAQRLAAGQVFYDIGANVGFFTVIAARLVGERGSVIAFEPLPANLEILRANIARNGFTHADVVAAAVSDHSGSGELQVSAFSGGSSLSSAERPPDFQGMLPVELVCIDALVASAKIPPPDGVKIDVEGAEVEVLNGMEQTLHSRHPWVIYEIDDHDPAALERKAQACAAFFDRLGYQVEKLEDSYPESGWLVCNYLATPRDFR